MCDLIPIGSVYKLVSPSGKIYIGSTKKTLAHRLGGHRTDYKRFLKGERGFVSSFVLFKESSNIKIELLEELKECSKIDLLLTERKHTQENICVNRVQPVRTDEEKKEYNKEFQKEYNIKNKDSVAKTLHEYYVKNEVAIKERQYGNIFCEACKCDTTKHHKARHEKTAKHIKNAKAHQQNNTATTINITNNYYATAK